MDLFVDFALSATLRFIDTILDYTFQALFLVIYCTLYLNSQLLLCLFDFILNHALNLADVI